MSNNIKQLRLSAGLTQEKLATDAGISKRAIEEWEGGRRVPRDVYALHKVAVVLGCSIEDLINFEDEEKPE